MNIKTIRKKSRITVKYLSNELKITQSGYYAKENGLRKFTALEIQKLCIIFNVSISNLNLEYNVRVTEN